MVVLLQNAACKCSYDSVQVVLMFTCKKLHSCVFINSLEKHHIRRLHRQDVRRIPFLPEGFCE